jgi:hypothetical protein
MCNCIETVEARLHERCLEQTFKKPFESVEIEQSFVMKDNKVMTRTFSRALITLKGQKKKIDTNIIHSYCPFCGASLKGEE